MIILLSSIASAVRAFWGYVNSLGGFIGNEGGLSTFFKSKPIANSASLITGCDTGNVNSLYFMALNAASVAWANFRASVLADSGTMYDASHTAEVLQQFNRNSLLNSFYICTCDSGKASSLYALNPFNAFAVTRSTVKWVLGQSGVLTSIPANTPAIEFNTDGTYRGLLVEPAGTNLVLQSSDLTTTWTNQGSTDTANTSVAPDGTTTADTVTGDGTNTTVFVNQNINFSTAGTYTFSFWAKAGTHDIIRVNIANYAGSTSSVTGYNLTTGTTTQATNTITAFPNGWYRVSFTFTIDAGDLSGSIRIFLSPDTGTTAWSVAADSNTKSVILWGAQLETGSVATSYIPTVASTQTRTADSVTLTGASSLIGQSAGTIYVEVEILNFAQVNARAILYLSDGTTNNRIAFQVGGNTDEVQFISSTSGSTLVSISTNNNPSGIQKYAGAYALNDFVHYNNGVLIGTDTSATVPATSRIDIGGFVGGNQFQGWIRSVAISTTRLPNATLASITTP